jgi:hypothetical protein
VIELFSYFRFLLPGVETPGYCRLSRRDLQTMNSEMHTDGHLTALGWTNFALYLIAALLSFRTAASVRGQQSSATGRVWLWIGVILAALGLNKQFDLQTLLIELGRQFAGADHLRAYRAELHALFFLGFMLAIILLLALVMLRFSAEAVRFARQLPLAAAGCILVCAYIVIRAVSIDNVDLMLGFDFERIPFLWLLEAGGLLLIIVQALREPK